eukprot:GEMP01022898.1.p1 GENE.GEMP01022898.1~~GEMP01022898.1.p1  ORF type:complete len:169 (+),score=18.18 GEMP01022898.1:156-662(+)
MMYPVQKVIHWGTIASRIYFSPQVAYVYGFFLVTNIAVLLASTTNLLDLGRGILVFLETILTLLFLFEVVLRMMVIGNFHAYFRNVGNVFDFVVCAICMWLCFLHHAPEWEQHVDEVFAESLLLVRTIVQVIRAFALYRRQKSRESQDAIDFTICDAGEEEDPLYHFP